MKDNDLLMIILAFISGFMLQGMMKNMCGGRLFEGVTNPPPTPPESCGGFRHEHYNKCEEQSWDPTVTLTGPTISSDETCATLQSAIGDTGADCRKYMCGNEAGTDLGNCGPFKNGYYVNKYFSAIKCARPDGTRGVVPYGEGWHGMWTKWLDSCVKYSRFAYEQVCEKPRKSPWDEKCPKNSP